MHAKCASWIKSLSLSLLICAATLPSPAHADPPSRLTDLGTLANDATFPQASPPGSCINAAGQIIGQEGLGTTDSTVGPVYHAFFYNSGVRRDIPPVYGGVNTTPIALNDFGASLIQTVNGNAFVYFYGVTLPIAAIPNGTGSVGVALNAYGQVIGSSFIGQIARGFLWDPINGTRDLGTLHPYPHHPGQFLGNSATAAINDSGLVTGTADTADFDVNGFVIRHAFVFDGAMHDLGTLSSDSAPGRRGHFLGQSVATAINAFGQIIGTADTSQTNDFGAVLSHAFVWDSAHGMRDLGTLQPDPVHRGQFLGNSVPLAINRRGQIIGISEAIGPRGILTTRAFLWTPSGQDGIAGNPQMKDLGVLPGGFASAPTGLNDFGQVIGVSDTRNFVQHAFLYSDGVLRDLTPQHPHYNSVAVAINASGQVAGNFDLSDHHGGVASHPFRFDFYGNSVGGSFTDLGTLPGGSISNVNGINDAGQIAGHSDTRSAPLNPEHAWIYWPQ